MHLQSTRVRAPSERDRARDHASDVLRGVSADEPAGTGLLPAAVGKSYNSSGTLGRSTRQKHLLLELQAEGYQFGV